MKREQRNRKAWKKWEGLVWEQAGSGQTISEFCRERGVGRQSFFVWRKRLQQAAPKQFVEVKLAAASPESIVARGAAIEVRLKNDRRLLVGPGFDASHLRALLAVVESAT
jgi:hypothetical protein